MFGNTLDDVRDKITKFSEVYEQYGLFGENGAFTSLFNGKKSNILPLETLSQFEEFKEKFNSSSVSAEALAEQMENVDERIITYAKTCKNGELTTKGFKESVEGMTLAEKAATAATKVFAVACNMAAMWAISKVVSGLYQLSQVSKDVAQNANELGNSFKNTSSGIENYKSQIEDLYKTINDSTSSYEDNTTARRNLLTLQDEMIEKFGSEAESIGLVNDAINGQTEALDALSKKKWKETLNEFNDGNLWNGVSNFFSGYSDNAERMLDEYGNYTVKIDLTKFAGFNGVWGNDQYKEFETLLKNTYGAEIKEVDLESNLNLNPFDDSDTFAVISGDATEVYEKLLDIQNLADQFDFNDSFSKHLTKLANSAKETSDQYKDMYNQYVLYEKIFKDDNYADSFNKITEAYNDYQNAFIDGNEDNIEQAKQDFADVIHEAANDLEDDSVINYFHNMYPDLMAEVGGWEFEVNFKANTDDLASDVHNDLLKFTASDDIKNINFKTASDEQIKAYNSLKAAAYAYGLELDQLIDKMESMGLIKSQDSIDYEKAKVKAAQKFNNGSAVYDYSEYDKFMSENSINTREEIAFWNQCIEEAQTKEEAMERYLNSDDSPNTIDSFSLNNQKDSIDNFQSSISTLQSSLSKLSELSTGDIVDLMQQFGDFDWESYGVTGAKGVGDLDGALRDLISSQKENIETTLINAGASDELIATFELMANTAMHTTEGMSNVTSRLSEIASAYQTVESALNEYAETGYMSIENATSMLNLSDVYLASLIDENNQLILNDNTYRSLIDARLDEAEAQATQQALQDIAGIYDETSAVEYLTSHNYSLAGSLYEKANAYNSVEEAARRALAAEGITVNQTKAIEGVRDAYNARMAIISASRNSINSSVPNTIGSASKGSSSSSNSSSSNSSSSPSTSSKDYDWMETRLNRLQTLIDQCTKSVDEFSDADMKNTGVDVLIAGTEKLQSNTESAYNKYMQLADSVNLPDELKALVRDGAIDISSISNDEISDAIDEYKKYFEAAEDLKGDLQDINIELGELHIEKLDNVISDICDGLEYANNKMDNLLGLMDDLADYDGTEITSGGLSKAFLYDQQMENSIKEAEKYNKLLEELNQLYETGKITQAQYTEKFEEYQSAQNKAVASVKEYEDAIVDLIKNGIQAEIDAMDELTQKKIDALKADKEQSEYADTVAEKQKYIANLEKQINQLALSDDRSDTAKRLQMQEELTEAKKDLADEQAEHSYNTAIDSLEAENEAYAEAKTKEQEMLDNDLEYRNEAISAFLANVEAGYGTIYTTLDQYAANYNLNLTEQLTTPWQYGETAVQSYANAISALSNISVPDFNRMFNPDDSDVPENNKPIGKYKIINSSGQDMYTGFNNWAEALDFKKKYIRKDSAYNTYTIKPYAKGTPNAKKGLALTQEEGLEAIMTDKGLLTPLKGGETVFNSEATKILYEFANNPEKYMASLNIPSISFDTLIPKDAARKSDMVINHNSSFVINGHMNDSEKKELTNLIDGQINKSYKKIQGRYYK